MLIRVTVKNAQHKIAMIKLVRHLTFMGLKEAKEFVEQHMMDEGKSFLVHLTNPTRVFAALMTYDDTLGWASSPRWANLIGIDIQPAETVRLTID